MKLTTFSQFTKTALAMSALVAMALPNAASAGVVFQSVANPTDLSKYTSPWCSGCSTNYRIFDQFTLTGAQAITGFSVALFSSAPFWGQGLNFSIWTVGSGNLPGMQLFSQNIGHADFSTQTLRSDTLLATTDDVTGLNLGAGTYYVSFYNTNLAVWGYTGGGGKLLQQGAAFRPGESAVFTLTGNSTGNTVPEPASLALVSLALLGAVGASRRRA